MKRNTIYALAILMCGMLSAPLFAMDAKASLKEADRLYSQGQYPEKALQIYSSIIADGSDRTSVILSKLKTAYVLEEQLMHYDKALVAYQRFVDDYPDSRLSKIVKNKSNRIQQLIDTGEIETYQQLKILERNSSRASKSGMEDLRRDATLELHQFAKTNLNASFSQDMVSRCLMALSHEKMFLRAHLLLRQFQASPSFNPSNKGAFETIQHSIKKAAIVMAAKIWIGLCILLVLTGRGFKKAALMVKERYIRLSVILLLLAVYMVAYHLLVRHYAPDQGLDMDQLYFVLIECAILTPFSILLYHSFPFLKEGIMKNIIVWITCALLGTSGWIFMVHHFRFLLETRM
jgi:hypothetical protein